MHRNYYYTILYLQKSVKFRPLKEPEYLHRFKLKNLRVSRILVISFILINGRSFLGQRGLFFVPSWGLGRRIYIAED